MSKDDVYGALETHFSETRLRQYLDEFSGDKTHALQLYRWNAQLAAAFFVDLGHVDVALRNALDVRMQARHVSLGRAGTWLDDPCGELGRNQQGSGRHRQPYKDISSARSRVHKNNKPDSHGQVLSETSFGLWHQLVSKRWTNLWPDLADAFPHAPNRARDTVAEPVAELRELRNRIGHHHRIWTLNGSVLHSRILEVAHYIDPDLGAWIGANSDVPALLAASPLAAR